MRNLYAHCGLGARCNAHCTARGRSCASDRAARMHMICHARLYELSAVVFLHPDVLFRLSCFAPLHITFKLHPGLLLALVLFAFVQRSQ